MRNDCSGNAPKGGGLLLLVKDDLKSVGHMPSTHERYKECETERVWTLIKGEGVKVAVCFVYLASTSVPGHVEFNKLMYEMLQTDMRQMREEGYVVFLMGILMVT